MSIRVGKYNYKTKNSPITPGYKNVLIHTSGPLSPYTMKDENGTIMENYWQFSKIWKKVDRIEQPISQYMPDKIRWSHVSEIHLKNDEITSKYWKWRNKGFFHDKWVRYPNGYGKHSRAVGSVIGNEDDYEIVDYITARKRIYYPKYREIAIKTTKFKQLKKMLDNGINIQIDEVDGPSYDKEYPYNLVKDGSIDITTDILIALINNPKQAFGHGYSLAACLLGIDNFD